MYVQLANCTLKVYFPQMFLGPSYGWGGVNWAQTWRSSPNCRIFQADVSLFSSKLESNLGVLDATTIMLKIPTSLKFFWTNCAFGTRSFFLRDYFESFAKFLV